MSSLTLFLWTDSLQHDVYQIRVCISLLPWSILPILINIVIMVLFNYLMYDKLILSIEKLQQSSPNIKVSSDKKRKKRKKKKINSFNNVKFNKTQPCIKARLTYLFWLVTVCILKTWQIVLQSVSFSVSLNQH